jgi:hypothetical protein
MTSIHLNPAVGFTAETLRHSAVKKRKQKSNREDAKNAKKTTKTPRHKESRKRG